MNTLKFNQIEFNHIGEQPSMPLQEKSVTITESGTTEVVPDSGYALKKVEVKVNTPQRDIRYYNANGIYTDTIDPFILLPVICHSSIWTKDDMVVMTIGIPDNSFENWIGVCIDFDAKIADQHLTDNKPTKIGAILRKYPEVLLIISKHEITEEEYYNLYK